MFSIVWNAVRIRISLITPFDQVTARSGIVRETDFGSSDSRGLGQVRRCFASRDERVRRELSDEARLVSEELKIQHLLPEHLRYSHSYLVAEVGCLKREAYTICPQDILVAYPSAFPLPLTCQASARDKSELAPPSTRAATCSDT